jgi:hypothetical protein
MMDNPIEIFTSIDNQTVVQVRFEQDTVWLNQKQLGELFDKDADTIGLHLKNIFLEEELDENSTTELFSVVQKEGKRDVKRKIKFYNLDAIISVGSHAALFSGKEPCFCRWEQTHCCCLLSVIFGAKWAT